MRQQLGDLSIDNQHLLHLSIKLGVASLHVVLHLVGTHGRVPQNRVDSRFDGPGQRGVAGGFGSLSGVLRQGRARPEFGRIAMILGLGAGHSQHPRLRFRRDGRGRAMRMVAQRNRYSRCQRSIHMLVDDASAEPQAPAESAEALPGVVAQQQLGALHLAQRGGTRSGQGNKLSLLFRRDDQGGTASHLGHQGAAYAKPD